METQDTIRQTATRTRPSTSLDNRATAQSRAERLAAEYLRAWGLRDPQTIAIVSQSWASHRESAAPESTAGPQNGHRVLMQRATAEMDGWLNRIGRHVCGDVDDLSARRGLLAIEAQAVIDGCPAALADESQLPPSLAERLCRAARSVAPPTRRRPMPEQPLGEITTPLKAEFWNRALASLNALVVYIVRLRWITQRAGDKGDGSRGARLALAALTFLTTLTGAVIFSAAMIERGAGWWLIVLLPLFAVLFLWVAISFWIATAGFLLRMFSPKRNCSEADATASDEPITCRTAILMPVYNESPQRAMAGLRAIYESLDATGEGAAFDFFVLSDSTDPDIWLAEELAWARLNQAIDGPSRVYYRHRTKNVGRKAGNIADFCERWGSQYSYMIVLDADSVMSGETICELVRRIDRDPQIGIMQAPPTPVNRASLFARCQQFASRMYGPIFLEGFAWWSGSDGNYWGHNAVLRVDAFTKCCGLPKLPGEGPLAGEILSHDFVEAALMNRAGYKVCLAHDLQQSYEECPPTLIDYAQRDQRWCQGNMQHLRLAFASGFRPISRLHLGMGAMSYLSSPLWMLSLVLTFVSVVFASVAGHTADRSTHAGAADAWGAWLFVATMGLLLLPKLWSYLLLLCEPRRLALFGGAGKAGAGILIETFVSILVAPIMMAFHSTFVLATLLGRRVTWDAQQRDERGLSFAAALKAHYRQTLAGSAAVAITLLFASEMLLWLLPVLIGLLLAVPLSMLLSSTTIGRRLAASGYLSTPEETAATTVLERHRHFLALPTPKEQADRRGLFRRVLTDPALLALHCCLLEATGGIAKVAGRPLLMIERQILAGGAAPISIDNRRAILSDPAALRSLQLLIWSSQREPS